MFDNILPIVIILMEEAMLTVVAEATLEATMVAVVKADAEGKIKEVEAMVEEDNNIRISFLSSSKEFCTKITFLNGKFVHFTLLVGFSQYVFFNGVLRH